MLTRLNSCLSALLAHRRNNAPQEILNRGRLLAMGLLRLIEDDGTKLVPEVLTATAQQIMPRHDTINAALVEFATLSAQTDFVEGIEFLYRKHRRFLIPANGIDVTHYRNAVINNSRKVIQFYQKKIPRTENIFASPLHEAVCNNDVNRVASMLNENLTVVKDLDNTDPLFDAVCLNHTEIVKRICQSPVYRKFNITHAVLASFASYHISLIDFFIEEYIQRNEFALFVAFFNNFKSYLSNKKLLLFVTRKITQDGRIAFEHKLIIAKILLEQILTANFSKDHADFQTVFTQILAVFNQSQAAKDEFKKIINDLVLPIGDIYTARQQQFFQKLHLMPELAENHCFDERIRAIFLIRAIIYNQPLLFNYFVDDTLLATKLKGNNLAHLAMMHSSYYAIFALTKVKPALFNEPNSENQTPMQLATRDKLKRHAPGHAWTLYQQQLKGFLSPEALYFVVLDNEKWGRLPSSCSAYLNNLELSLELIQQAEAGSEERRFMAMEIRTALGYLMKHLWDYDYLFNEAMINLFEASLKCIQPDVGLSVSEMLGLTLVLLRTGRIDKALANMELLLRAEAAKQNPIGGMLRFYEFNKLILSAYRLFPAQKHQPFWSWPEEYDAYAKFMLTSLMPFSVETRIVTDVPSTTLQEFKHALEQFELSGVALNFSELPLNSKDLFVEEIGEHCHALLYWSNNFFDLPRQNRLTAEEKELIFTVELLWLEKIKTVLDSFHQLKAMAFTKTCRRNCEESIKDVKNRLGALNVKPTLPVMQVQEQKQNDNAELAAIDNAKFPTLMTSRAEPCFEQQALAETNINLTPYVPTVESYRIIPVEFRSPVTCRLSHSARLNPRTLVEKDERYLLERQSETYDLDQRQEETINLYRRKNARLCTVIANYYFTLGDKQHAAAWYGHVNFHQGFDLHLSLDEQRSLYSDKMQFISREWDRLILPILQLTLQKNELMKECLFHTTQMNEMLKQITLNAPFQPNLFIANDCLQKSLMNLNYVCYELNRLSEAKKVLMDSGFVNVLSQSLFKPVASAVNESVKNSDDKSNRLYYIH